ncbi:hypothetical protein [Candidatus Protochlamydia amoebophila]|uniref:Fe2OG dioxygenase domain-containing protein n=1 Tax=Protochlamydia amoebophila (strain UWE25) TaxID=264201 RepID=Q6MA49_PARUW|nr:hypothetical protein [Candidatus Protochlamydia amoebophila]CAF24550.1 unnamed protein product [Candidatus Protochlamydia amoebophila UWE25]
MLLPIPVLNSTETEAILHKIEKLRFFWNKRQERFYTLGAALYLDKNIELTVYDKKIESNNLFLMLHFSDLYDRILDILKKELKSDVMYESSLALPGFHIFLSCPEFVKQGGKIHFDLQFKQANWSHYKEVDWSNPLSFTLALALPQQGGGLNYWDKPYDPQDLLNPAQAVKDIPSHYIEYEVGKMVLHNGLLIHQIAPAKGFNESDCRITLQGHAIRADGTWRIYW